MIGPWACTGSAIPVLLRVALAKSGTASDAFGVAHVPVVSAVKFRHAFVPRASLASIVSINSVDSLLRGVGQVAAILGVGCPS